MRCWLESSSMDLHKSSFICSSSPGRWGRDISPRRPSIRPRNKSQAPRWLKPEDKSWNHESYVHIDTTSSRAVYMYDECVCVCVHANCLSSCTAHTTGLCAFIAVASQIWYHRKLFLQFYCSTSQVNWQLKSQKTNFQHVLIRTVCCFLMMIRYFEQLFEQIEFLAKLLDFFSWSNKNDIDQW